MITLNDAAGLTAIRIEGVRSLIDTGVLPALGSKENVLGLSLPTMIKLQDLKVRCVKEAARAFGLPTGEMFRLVKTSSCIFDVEAGRVIIDLESEGYLVQELVKAAKNGGGTA